MCMPVFSNGTHLRTDEGMIIGREPEPQTLHYLAEQHGVRFSGHVSDEDLSGRIEHYIDEYFGARHTNCATFVYYLRTGIFQEFQPNAHNLIIGDGMRPFERAEKVDVGDTVLIMYAHNRFAASRRHTLGPPYRKIKKRRHKEGGFACTEELKLRPQVFSPVDLKEIYYGLCAEDFHFMICIDTWKGEPVWLSQVGYMLAGENPVVFALTLGDRDPYPSKVPLAAFIKKGR